VVVCMSYAHPRLLSSQKVRIIQFTVKGSYAL
jgi:hypothetical protein